MAQTNDPKNADDAEVVRLIREGWDHLHHQSPLAAWGSWQEALRRNPDSRATQQALATLESAGELPAAARAKYRFLSPGTAERRERWDARLRGATPEALAGAAGVFSDLTEADPDDAEAWYNRALCLSWIGQNREAIACLDRFVVLRAASDFDAAVSAWTLAEVLRQGRGAESLADDLRFAASIPWSAEESARLSRHFPGLRRIPTPAVPTSSAVATPDVVVYEWLEEPTGLGLEAPCDSTRGRLLLATVYQSGGAIRLSSPRADTLEIALENLGRVVDLSDREVRREAAPLPLPFLDAAVWTLRLPEGIDQAIADRLTREHVESYYENRWILDKRQGLDGHSPLEAAKLATGGDPVALAKLSAVIGLREQLGIRASVGTLYQGYPFDRLRNRLGLRPADGNAIDPDDLASASAMTLRKLDPSSLPDARLVSAFESAEGLRDDPLAERFAVELVGRSPVARRGVDLAKLTACLVRGHMSRKEPDLALERIRRIEPEATESDRRRLSTWRAEILARQGRGSEAAVLYRELLLGDPNPAITALDAAETLIDNGELSESHRFLEQAVEAAREEDLKGIEDRAKLLLDSLGQTS